MVRFTSMAVMTFLASASSASAYVVVSPTMTTFHRSTQLHMTTPSAPQPEQEQKSVGNTAAMSLFAASIITLSAGSAMTMLPEPVYAKTVAAEPVVVAAPTKGPAAAAAAKEAAAKKAAADKVAAEKAAFAKLSKEEKAVVETKKNYDLASESIKEYSKYVKEGKSDLIKAETAVKVADKALATVKTQYAADTDTLARAKSDKLPTPAMKELADRLVLSKDKLKAAEKVYGDATTAKSTAQKKIKVNEEATVKSIKSQKEYKSKLDGANKNLKKYQEGQAKKAKADAQKAKEVKAKKDKAIAAEKQRIKDLEKKEAAAEATQKAALKEATELKKKLVEEAKTLEKLK